MSKMMKFNVLREHGDFAVGDTRTADPAAVAHLVPRCLELVGPADGDDAGAKAEPPPKNKAEPAAPANKAATGRKAKAKA